MTARLVFLYIAYEQADKNILRALPALDGYQEIAENLLAGNGYTTSASPPFIPNSERAPIYPFFLVSIIYFFGNYWTVIILQILLASSIPLLAFLISEKFITNRGVAIFAGIFLAIEPLSLSFSTSLMTDSPSPQRNTFLSFGSFFATVIVAYFALTTMLVGLAVNARFRLPIIAFILIFAAYGFLETKKFVKSKLRKSFIDRKNFRADF